MVHAMHVRCDDERRKGASSHPGSAILAWLNMAQAFSITSNRNTASGAAPIAMTIAIFHSIDSPISIG